MDPEKTAMTGAVGDRRFAEPEPSELPMRDQAVLLAGQGHDLGVEGSYWSIWQGTSLASSDARP